MQHSVAACLVFSYLGCWGLVTRVAHSMIGQRPLIWCCDTLNYLSGLHFNISGMQCSLPAWWYKASVFVLHVPEIQQFFLLSSGEHGAHHVY